MQGAQSVFFLRPLQKVRKRKRNVLNETEVWGYDGGVPKDSSLMQCYSLSIYEQLTKRNIREDSINQN